MQRNRSQVFTRAACPADGTPRSRRQEDRTTLVGWGAVSSPSVLFQEGLLDSQETFSFLRSAVEGGVSLL